MSTPGSGAAGPSSSGGPSSGISPDPGAVPPRRPTRRVVNPPVPVRPRDPAIDRALSLSTFESSYSAEDFISTLSDKLISTSKSSTGPFDPKPFLETFSPALDSLLSLRSQVAERTKKMETDVRRAEREYGRRLRELDGGFEAIGSSFSSLESKINDVGRTAVRIGEQLEGLHQTRSTAQSTSLLLSYYLSLAHETSMTVNADDPAKKDTPLEVLFATRTSRDGRARLAIILRRLMAVAKDVADNAGVALSEAENPGLANAESEAANGANGAGGANGTSAGGGETKAADPRVILQRKKEKEKAERVRDEIERYCEKFEKECLRLFDRSYRKGDPRMMAHCAKTLQDFNGGASCVQIYVNQHDFFISHGKVVDDADKGAEDDSADIWKTIGDPDAPAPTTEPGLVALIKEIKITTSQEAQIVKAVFPNPIAVATVFLQRVFAQVIQQHIENLVTRASGISTLAVLRVLNLAHASCVSLVEELKTYDMTLSTGSSKTPGAAGAPLSAMLEHALEEIFVPWIEGQRYLERESKNLVELYGGLLSRFTRFHETVLKAKPNSILDKVVNQLSSSSSTTPGTTSSSATSNTAQSAAAAISRYANLFTSSAASAGQSIMSAAGTGNVSSPAEKRAPPLPIPGHVNAGSTASPTLGSGGSSMTRSDSKRVASPMLGQSGQKGPNGGGNGNGNGHGNGAQGLEVDKVVPEDGVLTPGMAERMLRWHAEAIGRVVELTPSADVGRTAFALSKVLAEGLGRGYIDIALDSALARIEQQDIKGDLDMSPLLALRPADQITHLWQRYHTTALLPLASSNTSANPGASSSSVPGGAAGVRREMISFNAHGIVRMEGKANAVLQKALDVIVFHLRHVLSRQKKNDYRPNNDEMSFARNQTEPCAQSCDFMEDALVKIRGSVSGKNAEALLTELGVAWHSLLLEHYKRWAVNPTGGLMLTKDLALYQETASHFGIPAVNDRFDMLRQLGNSFIVQPNVLRSYMTESHLGRIELRLLKPYLQQRSDYSSFAKSLNLDDLPEEKRSSNVIQVHTQASQSSQSHANRLSTISGVAGAGMGKLKGLLRELEGLGEEERHGHGQGQQGQGHGHGQRVSQTPAEREAAEARARAAAPSHYMFVGMH